MGQISRGQRKRSRPNRRGIPNSSLPFRVTEGEYVIVVDHDVRSNMRNRIEVNGADITGHLAAAGRKQGCIAACLVSALRWIPWASGSICGNSIGTTGSRIWNGGDPSLRHAGNRRGHGDCSGPRDEPLNTADKQELCTDFRRHLAQEPLSYGGRRRQRQPLGRPTPLAAARTVARGQMPTAVRCAGVKLPIVRIATFPASRKVRARVRMRSNSPSCPSVS
jgi:hypothetical protein